MKDYIHKQPPNSDKLLEEVKKIILIDEEAGSYPRNHLVYDKILTDNKLILLNHYIESLKKYYSEEMQKLNIEIHELAKGLDEVNSIITFKRK
jgi:hypothetical protein